METADDGRRVEEAASTTGAVEDIGLEAETLESNGVSNLKTGVLFEEPANEVLSATA